MALSSHTPGLAGLLGCRVVEAEVLASSVGSELPGKLPEHRQLNLAPVFSGCWPGEADRTRFQGLPRTAMVIHLVPLQRDFPECIWHGSHYSSSPGKFLLNIGLSLFLVSFSTRRNISLLSLPDYLGEEHKLKPFIWKCPVGAHCLYKWKKF